MESIVSMFSNLGVPVACLVAVFYLWQKEIEAHKEESEKSAEMQLDFCRALESNTAAINALCDKIENLR